MKGNLIISRKDATILYRRAFVGISLFCAAAEADAKGERLPPRVARAMRAVRERADDTELFAPEVLKKDSADIIAIIMKLEAT